MLLCMLLLRIIFTKTTTHLRLRRALPLSGSVYQCSVASSAYKCVSELESVPQPVRQTCKSGNYRPSAPGVLICRTKVGDTVGGQDYALVTVVCIHIGVSQYLVAVAARLFYARVWNAVCGPVVQHVLHIRSLKHVVQVPCYRKEVHPVACAPVSAEPGIAWSLAFWAGCHGCVLVFG